MEHVTCAPHLLTPANSRRGPESWPVYRSERFAKGIFWLRRFKDHPRTRIQQQETQEHPWVGSNPPRGYRQGHSAGFQEPWLVVNAISHLYYELFELLPL